MTIPRKKNQNNQSLYQESQDYHPNMNSLKGNQAEELKVMMKNSVWKTYE
jgi:hypothetical protein